MDVLLSACRRVLIFPKGNNVDHFSMYLDVADSGSLPYGWSRYAQFNLAVVNQIHPKYTIRKGIVSLLLALLFACLANAISITEVSCGYNLESLFELENHDVVCHHWITNKYQICYYNKPNMCMPCP
jgi:hypothetical protein